MSSIEFLPIRPTIMSALSSSFLDFSSMNDNIRQGLTAIRRADESDISTLGGTKGCLHFRDCIIEPDTMFDNIAVARNFVSDAIYNSDMNYSAHSDDFNKTVALSIRPYLGIFPLASHVAACKRLKYGVPTAFVTEFKTSMTSVSPAILNSRCGLFTLMTMLDNTLFVAEVKKEENSKLVYLTRSPDIIQCLAQQDLLYAGDVDYSLPRAGLLEQISTRSCMQLHGDIHNCCRTVDGLIYNKVDISGSVTLSCLAAGTIPVIMLTPKRCPDSRVRYMVSVPPLGVDLSVKLAPAAYLDMLFQTIWVKMQNSNGQFCVTYNLSKNIGQLRKTITTANQSLFSSIVGTTARKLFCGFDYATCRYYFPNLRASSMDTSPFVAISPFQMRSVTPIQMSLSTPVYANAKPSDIRARFVDWVSREATVEDLRELANDILNGSDIIIDINNSSNSRANFVKILLTYADYTVIAHELELLNPGIMTFR